MSKHKLIIQDKQGLIWNDVTRGRVTAVLSHIENTRKDDKNKLKKQMPILRGFRIKKFEVNKQFSSFSGIKTLDQAMNLVSKRNQRNNVLKAWHNGKLIFENNN
jgi:hypothetical protein